MQNYIKLIKQKNEIKIFNKELKSLIEKEEEIRYLDSYLLSLYQTVLLNFIKSFEHNTDVLDFKQNNFPELKIKCVDYYDNKLLSNDFKIEIKANFNYNFSRGILLELNVVFYHQNEVLKKEQQLIKVGLKYNRVVVVSEESFLYNYEENTSYINKPSILIMIMNDFLTRYEYLKNEKTIELFNNHGSDTVIFFIKFISNCKYNEIPLTRSTLEEKYEMDSLINDINHPFPIILLSIFN